MPRNLLRKERTEILVLHRQGLNVSQISEELNVARATVRRWIARYEAEGSIDDRPRLQPPRGSYKGKKSKVAVKIDRTSKLNPIQAVNIDDDDSASKTDSALDCPSKSEEQLLIETALSTVCRLCMRGRGSLDLTEPLEENKTLADMLSDCYGITLSCMSEAGRSRLACSECAASLQRASAFKRRVLLAEHVFAEHCRQPQTDDHDGNSKGNDSITEIKEKTSTLPPVVSRAAKRPNRRDTGAKSSKVTRQSDKNIVILQNKKNIIDSGSSDSDTTNKADKHKDIDDTIGNYGENISDIMETDGNNVDDIGNCTENICDVMETDGNKVDDVIGNDRTNIGDNIENHGNNIDVRKAVQNSSLTRNFGNQYVFDVVSSEPEYILPNSDIYSMTIKEEIKVEVEDECEKYESSSDDSDDEE